MNADITLLQHQAAQALPTWPKRKPGPVGRWSPLWPVYAELRRKGFTIREAIDWLIREGAVPAKDRKKAEYGLPMVDSRRRRDETAVSGARPAATPALKPRAKPSTGATPLPARTRPGSHSRKAAAPPLA